VTARFIRIFPVTWNSHMSMRAGVTAQVPVTNPPESARTYSSIWGNDQVGTGHARSMLGSKQAWSSGSNAAGHWMQIDLQGDMTVTSVVTQGRAGSVAFQYVTKYKVATSLDGTTFTYVPDSYPCPRKCEWGDAKEFNGNTDSRGDEVQSALPKPVTARFIRIFPVTWNSHMSMRAGVMAQASW